MKYNLSYMFVDLLSLAEAVPVTHQINQLSFLNNKIKNVVFVLS